MDRNSVIGLVLIAVILIGYSIFTRPNAEQVAKMRREKDSIEVLKQLQAKQQQAQANDTKTTEVKKTTVEKEADTTQFGLFSSVSQGKEQFVNIENNLMKVTLSTKGGRVYSVELKQYKRWDGKPLILFQGDSSQLGLRFFSNNRAMNTGNLYFTPVENASNSSVSMRAYAGN